jgi:nucleotide-binding universal stress UspA family protein
VFDKILVALDGSDHAKKALETAIALSQRCDATLVLFHAIAPHALRGDYEAMVAKTARELFSQVGQEIADDLLSSATEQVKAAGLSRVEPLAVEGDPAKTLVDSAQQVGADLIVMGTRGLTGLHEIALGSVAHKVTNAAQCPVLIIK